MNTAPHDASKKTEREPDAPWVCEPEPPDFESEHRPVPEEGQQPDEPGYGHGV